MFCEQVKASVLLEKIALVTHGFLKKIENSGTRCTLYTVIYDLLLNTQ